MNDRSIGIGMFAGQHRQLGCIEEDIEGIVEQALYITGVEVAALCTSKKDSLATKVSICEAVRKSCGYTRTRSFQLR